MRVAIDVFARSDGRYVAVLYSQGYGRGALLNDTRLVDRELSLMPPRTHSVGFARKAQRNGESGVDRLRVCGDRTVRGNPASA